MKFKKTRLKDMLLGSIITLLLAGLVVPAAASMAAKSITVQTGVSIYKDDKPVVLEDAKGNPVEAFIYNGTTYLPVRAISNAFGSPIQWDGKTQRVYIGKHESTEPAVLLKDLDYFTGDKYKTATTMKDNLGNTHYNVLYNNITNTLYQTDTNTYRINGQYSRISGCFFQTYENRSSTAESPFSIYGDGKLLYTTTMTGGMDPQNFDVDISGVLELKIVLKTGGYDTCSAIGECGLYT